MVSWKGWVSGKYLHHHNPRWPIFLTILKWFTRQLVIVDCVLTYQKNSWLCFVQNVGVLSILSRFERACVKQIGGLIETSIYRCSWQPCAQFRMLYPTCLCEPDLVSCFWKVSKLIFHFQHPLSKKSKLTISVSVLTFFVPFFLML